LKDSLRAIDCRINKIPLEILGLEVKRARSVNDSLERRVRFYCFLESARFADVLDYGKRKLAFIICGVRLLDLVGFRLASDCGDD